MLLDVLRNGKRFCLRLVTINISGHGRLYDDYKGQCILMVLHPRWMAIGRLLLLYRDVGKKWEE